MPVFTSKEISSYFEESNKCVFKSSTTISKNFARGSQFIAESFIDVDQIGTKFDDDYFYMKGLCAASLRSKNKWVSLALNRKTGKIEHAYCLCEAGAGGLCSHSYALMRLTAQWSLDGAKELPMDKPCTSKACVWSVPKGRTRIEKKQIMDLTFSSPKKNQNGKGKKTKGIASTLFEARAERKRSFDPTGVKKLKANFIKENCPVPASIIFMEEACYGFCQTTVGSVPLGSPLSFHCVPFQPGFNVYCSIDLSTNCTTSNSVGTYPAFPLTQVPSWTNELERQVSCPAEKDIINSLKLTTEQAVSLEEETRDQSACKKWYEVRKYRFTASSCKDLKEKKTDRGLSSLARKYVSNKELSSSNSYVKRKLDHGRFYEPIAIQKYEQYMLASGRPVRVDKCGFVVNPNNSTYGATPDGRVTDLSYSEHPYGLCEAKCPEEYKDYDPRDAVNVTKDFCLSVSDDGTVHIIRPTIIMIKCKCSWQTLVVSGVILLFTHSKVLLLTESTLIRITGKIWFPE